MPEDMETLKYPIGRFRPPRSLSAAERESRIEEIAELPAILRRVVEGLTDDQLDTPYRPEGWTVRQVVHHVPDSHMNAYIRFRLALTEDLPRIKPYHEERWAELPDGRMGPIEESLALVRTLHTRWVRLLRSMSNDDWQRAYDHPESGAYPLWKALAMYAWHGRHHAAHITTLRERQGW